LFDALGLDQVPKFIESTRHRVDAAASELVAKTCSFVAEGQGAVDRVRASIKPSTNDFESIRRLDNHLADFRSALTAIPCSLPQSSSLDLLAPVAAAAKALDDVRKDAADLLQNPAVL